MELLLASHTLAIDELFQLPFYKAHGTQNDFVVIEDKPEITHLSQELITRICDRKTGIGADGVIRIITAGRLLELGVITTLPEGVTPGMLFMDYYNNDGSAAEMCGNGARVFAHLAYALGHVDTKKFTIGTRGGAREVTINDESAGQKVSVTVDMGPVDSYGTSEVLMRTTNKEYMLSGYKLSVANPHLACVISPGYQESSVALGAWDLSFANYNKEDFPQGVNIELVYPKITPDNPETPLMADMRVLERGSGETFSCGTGAVAAAWALSKAVTDTVVQGQDIEITLPGGTLVISFGPHNAYLTGPSYIVGSGTILVPAAS